jgi:NAD-dependent dihydropyrimidine dehydrogenase PreA subunit
MPSNSGNIEKIAGITQALGGGEIRSAQTTYSFDVPVIVDEAKCINGCTICVDSCPVDCLALNAETLKAFMKFDECWYCLACEVDCPANAITVKIPFLVR